MNFYAFTKIYPLIPLSLTCVIITAIFWIFGQKVTSIPRDLKVIINILFADLIWSLVQIIQIFRKDAENLVLKIIMGTIQTFTLEVSATFAVQTAFCAYKSLNDNQYLQREGKYRTIMIVGYVFPTFACILQSSYRYDFQFFSEDPFLLDTSYILYAFICVVLSSIFYMKVKKSYGVLKLNDREMAEVNTLFMFPLIMLIFVLMPQMLFQATFWCTSKTAYIVLYTLGVIIYPLYGLQNCWAYGMSLKRYTRNNRNTNNSEYDSNLDFSLFQSHINDISHESSISHESLPSHKSLEIYNIQ